MGKKTALCPYEEFQKMSHHTKHKEFKERCMHCLTGFTTKEVWAKRKEICISINGRQAIQMPEKGIKVQFQDQHKQMPVPVRILGRLLETCLGVGQIVRNHIRISINTTQHAVMYIN